MHIHHTHPQFGDSFFTRFEQIKQLWDKHPILSQKQRIIEELHSSDVSRLPKQLTEFIALVDGAEKPLLAGMRFSIKKNNPYVPNSIKASSTLAEEKKAFVKKHQGTVSSRCSDSFQSLIEYAVISETKAYSQVSTDYAHFQTAVDAVEQANDLQKHLDSQIYLAKKIKTKLQSQSELIHADVQTLKESHESQLGVMARLPQFSFE